jgi:hypothetical protein
LLSAKLIGPLALLITIYQLTASVSGQSASAGSEDVIGQARRSYYSLPRHGFNGFEATIEPNWKITLGPTATPENLKIFPALHFTVTVDATGAATVTQVAAGQKTKIEPYVKQIHDHMQQLVARFFRTWALFMISSPFPDSQIKIERFDNRYRLLYAVQSAEVRLTMTHDLLIEELRITDPMSRRTVNPVFRNTSDGLVLTGYRTVFEPVGPGSKSTLQTMIDYRDVSGLKLPNKIHITGMNGVEPIEAELKFNQYVPNSPH